VIDPQINCCSFYIRFSNYIDQFEKKKLIIHLNQTFASEELGTSSKGGCQAGTLHSQTTAAEQYSKMLEVLK